MQIKAVRPIFHKTDFHLNDPAAFVCAQHLVDMLAHADGKPVPFWTRKLEVRQIRFSGGQALFMPLFRPPSEDGLFVEPNWDESGYLRDKGSAPFEVIYTKQQHGEGLPTTVVFGDFFIDGMVRSGLVTYFEKLAYARLYQAELADVLRAMPPGTKYFVFEFMEVALPNNLTMELPDKPRHGQ